MALSTVAVVVPQRPGFFELGVVQEVFGVDRTDDGVPAIDFRVCSENPGEPIAMDNGITLTTPFGLEAAEDADLVVAPAYDYANPPSEALLDVFRRAHARGAWVLSVCSGAFLLGEAGLLDGHACTTHWRHTDELKRRFPRRASTPTCSSSRTTGSSPAPAPPPASTPACTTCGASSAPRSPT